MHCAVGIFACVNHHHHRRVVVMRCAVAHRTLINHNYKIVYIFFSSGRAEERTVNLKNRTQAAAGWPQIWPH